jgi:hypothetical protein
VLKKDSRNKSADPPDVRADDPERAMEQFTQGLRRVLAVPKNSLTQPRQSKARKQSACASSCICSTPERMNLIKESHQRRAV